MHGTGLTGTKDFGTGLTGSIKLNYNILTINNITFTSYSLFFVETRKIKGVILKHPLFLALLLGKYF
jgi:hypothetical protein